MTTQESSPRSSIAILDDICGAEVSLMKLRQCSGQSVLDQVEETPAKSIGASPLRRKNSLLDQDDDEEDEETEHEYPPYSCCVWQSHSSPLKSTISATTSNHATTATTTNTAATRKISTHRRHHNHRRNLMQSFAPSPPRVLKVRSFSAAENTTLHTTTSSRKSNSNKNQPSLWQCGASLEAIAETSSQQRVLQDQENDGYTSDPELVTTRTQSSSAPRWTSLLQHQHDDTLLVQVLWNLPLHVVWHVSSCQSSNKNNNKTIPIVAYVEKGHLLSRTVVPPKLVWRPRRRSMNSESSVQQQHHIELLQIQRILPWQRHGVQIHYKDNQKKDKNTVLHLECPTHKDRTVLVYSIKVLISRLASALIVAGEHDENKTLLHEEFFYPSDRVPGGWE